MNMNMNMKMKMKPYSSSSSSCYHQQLQLIGVRSWWWCGINNKSKSSSSRLILFRSSSSSVQTTPTITRVAAAAESQSNNTSPPSPHYNNHNHSYYVPDANFYKIEAILRPWRIPQVSSALLKMGIRGVTVSDVRGFGAQGGLTERQAGSEFSEDKFLAKVKMEIVVSKEQVEAVIDKIITEARTGEIGDGKIFLLPVADVIRVRTGERGENAERMLGGRSDMSSSV